MVTINLDVVLDEKTEREARSRGLLSSEKIAQMIENELREQLRDEAGARLAAKMDILASHMQAKYADLSEDEAQAMIDQWIEEADTDNESAGSTTA